MSVVLKIEGTLDVRSIRKLCVINYRSLICLTIFPGFQHFEPVEVAHGEESNCYLQVTAVK